MDAAQASFRRARWLSWLLGAAVLSAVVAAGLHFSEEEAFVRQAQRAEPWWLLAAIALQASTYVAQGEIWWKVAHVSGFRLSRQTAFELSVAKLFADQALPSAGLSSSILVAHALGQRRHPAATIKAAVLINLASYHLAYAAALAAALAVLAWRGDANALVSVTSGVFLLFSAGLSAVVLKLSGRPIGQLPGVLGRWPAMGTAVDFVATADPRLVRNRSVLRDTIALQVAIVLLDAGTVWVLLRAVGATASMSGVYASFMVASLFRTMGIIPGGLGTFEATSVLMLRTVGVGVAEALSATLLFRGLSFWLPMLPGYWCSRRVVAPDARERL